jgi:hypothetical protein
MIHDMERVAAIRVRATSQIELIKSLQAQIVEGRLDALEVALNQTNDIETFFIADLDRNERTPAQEAKWLSAAENMLSVWGPYLQNLRDHFGKAGGRGIQVIGG